MPTMNTIQEILSIFEQVAAIPRESKHEQQISRWLQDWAATRGLYAQTDQAGNLVIRVPATPGYEKAVTVILQGHMDMVCEKTPDSPHDFSRDPIRCIVEGDWLHADQTTLGADNGIAIALALALVDNPQIAHPPLELLFTVEEEIGIGGAERLQKGFVDGKILVNLDSEEEGVFMVGCAGGKKTKIHLPLSFEPVGEGQVLQQIIISGLKGGHSGIDIHKHRANANQLLARLLGEVAAHLSFNIADLKGGTAHNAIPRQAQATIVLQADNLPELEKVFHEFRRTLQDEFAATESSLTLDMVPARANLMITCTDSEKTVYLLQSLPHGVMKMSASIEGFVETSNNLAVIEVCDNRLQIISSQRSVVMSQLDEITRRIEAVARLAGAQVAAEAGYPAWQPDLNSPLLARSCRIYEHLFGMPARVKTIHAGLECGSIGMILGGMDMISIGATIHDPHSPNERLYIPSLLKVWDFLVELLKSYGKDTNPPD